MISDLVFCVFCQQSLADDGVYVLFGVEKRPMHRSCFVDHGSDEARRWGGSYGVMVRFVVTPPSEDK